MGGLLSIPLIIAVVEGILGLWLLVQAGRTLAHQREAQTEQVR